MAQSFGSTPSSYPLIDEEGKPAGMLGLKKTRARYGSLWILEDGEIRLQPGAEAHRKKVEAEKKRATKKRKVGGKDKTPHSYPVRKGSYDSYRKDSAKRDAGNATSTISPIGLEISDFSIRKEVVRLVGEKNADAVIAHMKRSERVAEILRDELEKSPDLFAEDSVGREIQSKKRTIDNLAVTFKYRYDTLGFVCKAVHSHLYPKKPSVNNRREKGASNNRDADKYINWAQDRRLVSKQEAWLVHQIAAGKYHVFEFDDDAYDAALDCYLPIEYLPYSVSIVTIPSLKGDADLAAFDWKGSIEYCFVGDYIPGIESREKLMAVGKRLLSFVANLCTPVYLDGYLGFENSGSLAPHITPRTGKEKGEGAVFVGNKVSFKSRDLGGTHASPSEPFMRKAHTRRQHYGPHNSLVKIVHIKETLVTGDNSQKRVESSTLPSEKRYHRVILAKR